MMMVAAVVVVVVVLEGRVGRWKNASFRGDVIVSSRIVGVIPFSHGHGIMFVSCDF